MKYAKSDADRENIRIERDKHHEMAELAYDAKKQGKELSQNSGGLIHFSTFDSQQYLPCPLLRTSVYFYKSSASTCYTWHERTAKIGGTEIASCVYKHLRQLSSSVKHAVNWSDGCSGQHKNKMVCGMCSAFEGTKDGNCRSQILVPGHTHMECDSDH